MIKNEKKHLTWYEDFLKHQDIYHIQYAFDEINQSY